jgi:hypothetical protein
MRIKSDQECNLGTVKVLVRSLNKVGTLVGTNGKAMRTGNRLYKVKLDTGVSEFPSGDLEVRE